MNQRLLLFILAVACRHEDALEPVDSASPPAPILAADLAAHLNALQVVASAHDNHRSSGSSGYAASVDYVADTLEGWGYNTRREPFSFVLFRQLAIGALNTTDGTSYTSGTHFLTVGYSPPGDVTAPTFALPITAPTAPANSSTSGCDPAHWANFPAGHIAVIQRGGCTFNDKVTRAQAAGAVAALIFNEGQPGRDQVEGVTLQQDANIQIPCLFTDYYTGVALGATIADVQVIARTELALVASENLHATLIGQTNSVIAVGAHLDSVPEGPGINDNGTGVAVTLELARRLAAHPETRVKSIQFSFWGAEELGLIGSFAYAGDAAQLAPIDLYLNLDMVGSPNGFRFVLNANAEAAVLGVPPRAESLEAQAAFTDWFEREGLPHATTPMLGRSDHAPFMLGNVPVAGLFTGANETALTAEQAASTGGAVGEPHDACYHEACDNIDNVDLSLLSDLARAAEHVISELANQEPRSDRTKRPAVPLSRSPFLTHAVLQ